MKRFKKLFSLKISSIYSYEYLTLLIINVVLIDGALLIELLYGTKIGIFFIIGAYCISFLANKDFNIRWFIPASFLSLLFGSIFFLISLLQSFFFLQLIVAIFFLILIAIFLTQQYDNAITLTVIGYYSYIVFAASLYSQIHGFAIKNTGINSLALFLGAFLEAILINFLLKESEKNFSHRSWNILFKLASDTEDVLKTGNTKVDFYKQLLANSEYLKALNSDQQKLYNNFYISCDKFYSFFLIGLQEIKKSKKIVELQLNNTLLDFLYFLNSELKEHTDFLKRQNYNSRYKEYVETNLQKYTTTCIIRLKSYRTSEFKYKRELYINFIYMLSKEIRILFDASLEIEFLNISSLSRNNFKKESILYIKKLIQRIRSVKAIDIISSFAIFHALRITIVIIVGEYFLHYEKNNLFYWVFFITPLLVRDYLKTLQDRIYGILIGSLIGTILGVIFFSNFNYISYDTKTIFLMLLYPILFIAFYINYSFYSAIQVLRSILQLNILFELKSPTLIRFASTIISIIFAYLLVISTSWIRTRALAKNFQNYKKNILLYINTPIDKVPSENRYELIGHYLRLLNILSTAIKIAFRFKKIEDEAFKIYISKLFILATYAWSYDITNKKLPNGFSLKAHMTYLENIEYSSFAKTKELKDLEKNKSVIRNEQKYIDEVLKKKFLKKYNYINPNYLEIVLSFAYLNILKEVVEEVFSFANNQNKE